ncbi:MAG: extracellular solute-binding protein [Oscillospiraceae bacterium]|nr:extracellular solute-binding protein [Candidatus Equicaccousia limihippi]
MKTRNLAKYFSKYFALLLVLVMMFSSCAPAGEIDDEEEEEEYEEEEYETVTNADGTTTTVKKTVTKKDGNNKGDNNGGNNGGGSSKSTTWGSTNCKEIIKKMPTDVAKKGVHVLMWRSYSKGEKAAVDAFQKATGCKVRTTIAKGNAYGTKLQALISGKDSPDVVMIDSDSDWPGLAINSCLPLDKYKFRLDDSCWNKNQMNTVTAKGKNFGVACTGSFINEDINYIVYYFPSVLKANGITTMPYDLWKAGKWNWDAAYNIAKTFHEKSKKTGIEFLDRDAWADACGTGLVTYDYKNSKFINNIADANKKKTIINAWSQLSKLNDAGLCAEGFDTQKLGRGDCGMYCSISYGVNSENDWFGSVSVTGGAKSVECVPVPAATQSSAYVPYRSKCWGVAKGAKNVDGAAYFLRYYLDPSSANQENLYYNDKCKEVFKYITAASTKKNFMCVQSIINYQSYGKFETIRGDLAGAQANALTTVLDKHNPDITSAVSAANNLITKRLK